MQYKKLKIPIDRLMREIERRETIEEKNKFSSLFLKEHKKKHLEPYLELAIELFKMKQRGQDYITNESYDNIGTELK